MHPLIIRLSKLADEELETFLQDTIKDKVIQVDLVRNGGVRTGTVVALPLLHSPAQPVVQLIVIALETGEELAFPLSSIYSVRIV